MAEQNTNQSAAPQTEQTLNQSEALVLKYKNAIIACVCVIVLVVAGYVGFENFYKAPKEREASTAMAKAQEFFANQDYVIALNGDSVSTKGFLQIADDYSSTKAGNLANLYAGLCYAHTDQWENAVKYLEKYDGQSDQMVSPAALGALGNAYAHMNDLDKAVATLKKAAEKADNNSLSPTFLIQAAQILESQDKKDEALKLYKQVKEKYFQSMQYQTIDEYIERASK